MCVVSRSVGWLIVLLFDRLRVRLCVCSVGSLVCSFGCLVVVSVVVVCLLVR